MIRSPFECRDFDGPRTLHLTATDDGHALFLWSGRVAPLPSQPLLTPNSRSSQVPGSNVLAGLESKKCSIGEKQLVVFGLPRNQRSVVYGKEQLV